MQSNINVYVINLDHELYKWNNFLKNNNSYSTIFNFIRFSAINIPENPVKGCFLSHLKVAEINKTLNNKYYIVFEDDCIIKPSQIENITIILKFLTDNNNWHIFNGNPNCRLLKRDFKIVTPLHKFISVKNGKSSNFLIVNTSINLWEYLYKIDELFNNDNIVPFDKFISNTFQIITFYPYITLQAPGYSSIRCEYVDYTIPINNSESFIHNFINNRTLHLYFQGRLGNRLFQLFTALRYAFKFNYYIKCYSIKPIVYKSEVLNKIPTHNLEKNIELYPLTEINDEEIFEIMKFNNYNSSILFNGYFQNYHNFRKYKDQIIKYLNLNTDLINIKNNIQIYDKNINNTDIVGIHLRRTDYIKKNKTYIYYSFEQCYKKALIIKKDYDIIDRKFKIIIFSDDINYCKNEVNEYKNKLYDDIDHNTDLNTKLDGQYLVDVENIINFDKNFIYFDQNEKQTFETMMQLKFFILSNSTFSWMAAFLSNKIKRGYMPEKWLTFTEKNPDIPHPRVTISNFKF